jgi:hypothetical protein
MTTGCGTIRHPKRVEDLPLSLTAPPLAHLVEALGVQFEPYWLIAVYDSAEHGTTEVWESPRCLKPIAYPGSDGGVIVRPPRRDRGGAR